MLIKIIMKNEVLTLALFIHEFLIEDQIFKTRKLIEPIENLTKQPLACLLSFTPGPFIPNVTVKLTPQTRPSKL